MWVRNLLLMMRRKSEIPVYYSVLNFNYTRSICKACVCINVFQLQLTEPPAAVSTAAQRDSSDAAAAAAAINALHSFLCTAFQSAVWQSFPQ